MAIENSDGSFSSAGGNSLAVAPSANVSGAGNVSYVLPILQNMSKQYDMISDCLAGEIAVKDKRTVYLPKPNASDQSIENNARYDAYLLRAVFYNVAQRTLAGLVGQVFIREPSIKVPTALDNVVKDATGEGVGLIQEIKTGTEYVVSYGRGGLYVDYPETNNGASIAQIEAGDIRPTINLYLPKTIINWRTITVGAKKILSLVVLKETYTAEDDGFEAKVGVQYRVLRLVNNIYTVTLFRDESQSFYKQFTPVDYSGKAFNEIPFKFMGVTKNDCAIDLPPMYDLCSINIAHYRNSADYEESCYVVGQATPVISGLTKEWLDDVLKGTLAFGSRGGIPLPTGATANLLQATEQSMQKEAMDTKERQMVALGAKLVQQTQVQRTATEADQENTSEASILSSAAKNVGAAFVWALEWCGKFVDGNIAGIECDLNAEFDLVSLSPQERQQLGAEWNGGQITFGEMRDNLKRAGVANSELTDEEALTQIQQEQAASYQFEAQANPNNPANPDNPNNQPDANELPAPKDNQAGAT